MSDIVNISSSAVIIGNFDSRRRYLRKDLTLAATAFDVPLGFTLEASRSGGTARRVVYRYSVNGYVVQQTNSFGPTLTFNATVVRAKL